VLVLMMVGMSAAIRRLRRPSASEVARPERAAA
jgi:hypothetical protein